MPGVSSRAAPAPEETKSGASGKSGVLKGGSSAAPGNAEKQNVARPLSAANNSPEIELPDLGSDHFGLDSTSLLSAPLDDLLASMPEEAPGASPLGPATGLGSVKKPAPAKGPSLWDSTWFLIAFGIFLAMILIGIVYLGIWLFR